MLYDTLKDVNMTYFEVKNSFIDREIYFLDTQRLSKYKINFKLRGQYNENFGLIKLSNKGFVLKYSTELYYEFCVKRNNPVLTCNIYKEPIMLDNLYDVYRNEIELSNADIDLDLQSKVILECVRIFSEVDYNSI